ncbi:hypothetical protein [Paraburkholderia unamae]|uniref:hypothetical protein n=1 Tax=Paraburkholderia unamae TaxID=219649 RepID=UPI001CC5E7B8|nr:hypothetical protein [Paraburkholderia unamae]
MLRRILFELAGAFVPAARKSECLLLEQDPCAGVLPETADEFAIANKHDLLQSRDSAAIRLTRSSRRHWKSREMRRSKRPN